MEASHQVAAKRLELILHGAFLDRFNNTYLIEFQQEYKQLETMMENCVHKPDHTKCNDFLERASNEAMRGQLPNMPDSHKSEHNAVADILVNAFNILGRMSKEE